MLWIFPIQASDARSAEMVNYSDTLLSKHQQSYRITILHYRRRSLYVLFWSFMPNHLARLATCSEEICIVLHSIVLLKSQRAKKLTTNRCNHPGVTRNTQARFYVCIASSITYNRRYVLVSCCASLWRISFLRLAGIYTVIEVAVAAFARPTRVSNQQTSLIVSLSSPPSTQLSVHAYFMTPAPLLTPSVLE